jgi:hypothetical protein
MDVKTIIAIMSLALVPGTVVGQPGAVTATDAETALAGIVDALSRDQIARVEVVHVPTRILTRTRLTPEMLDATFDYKFVVRDLRSSVYREDIVRATRSLSVQRDEQMADLRWGLAFYGPDESRIGALYFSGSGSRGAVNAMPVSFRGELFRLLERRLSHAFR